MPKVKFFACVLGSWNKVRSANRIDGHYSRCRNLLFNFCLVILLNQNRFVFCVLNCVIFALWLHLPIGKCRIDVIDSRFVAIVSWKWHNNRFTCALNRWLLQLNWVERVVPFGQVPRARRTVTHPNRIERKARREMTINVIALGQCMQTHTHARQSAMNNWFSITFNIICYSRLPEAMGH